MRHRVYGKKLSRNKNQRTALFKSLIGSLILFEKIETTEAKAKAIKGLVDRIITQAKSETTRRLVSQFLTQKKVQDKLSQDLVARLGGRSSGYVSTIRLGRRAGDGAMMVEMKLLLEESKTPAKKSESKKTDAVEIVEEQVADLKVEVKKDKKTTKAKKETKK